MTIDAAPSASGTPQTWAAITPMNATTSPAIAAMSSSKIVKIDGSFEALNAATSGLSPRVLLNSLIATVADPISSTRLTASTR